MSLSHVEFSVKFGSMFLHKNSMKYINSAWISRNSLSLPTWPYDEKFIQANEYEDINIFITSPYPMDSLQKGLWCGEFVHIITLLWLIFTSVNSLHSRELLMYQ